MREITWNELARGKRSDIQDSVEESGVLRVRSSTGSSILIFPDTEDATQKFEEAKQIAILDRQRIEEEARIEAIRSEAARQATQEFQKQAQEEFDARVAAAVSKIVREQSDRDNAATDDRAVKIAGLMMDKMIGLLTAERGQAAVDSLAEPLRNAAEGVNPTDGRDIQPEGVVPVPTPVQTLQEKPEDAVIPEKRAAEAEVRKVVEPDSKPFVELVDSPDEMMSLLD